MENLSSQLVIFYQTPVKSSWWVIRMKRRALVTAVINKVVLERRPVDDGIAFRLAVM